MPDEAPPSPAVLANRGVPISLARLDDEGNVVTKEDGSAKTERVFLRFDANVVAQVETAYDGIMAPVDLTRVVPVVDPETGERVKGPDGSFVRIEEVVGQEMRPHFGLEAFQIASTRRPQSVARDLIAMALRKYPDGLDEVGRRMLPGEAIRYQAAVGTAWAMAQGVDPTGAAKMLAASEKALAAGTASIDDLLGQTTPD